MAYTKVSIPKFEAGAGAPIPKESNILIFLASDVLTMPSKVPGGVVSASALVLKEGAKGIGIYVNPISIARNDNQEGDANTETAGWRANVACSRPGDDEHFAAWKQQHLNEGVIIMTRECGESKGTRLHGTPCNPMYMSGVEEQDNAEGKMTPLTFVQGQRSKFKSIHYRHAIPALADNATIEDGSGSGSGSAGGGV